MNAARRPRISRRAFTLIEILLAVALLGALLLALNVFIFSMGEIWGRGSEQRLFNEHVRAVTRHVEQLVRAAAIAPAALQSDASVLSVAEIRVGGGREPLVTFELPAGDRVLRWPGPPLPDVVCSLAAVSGRGLVIYWHSRHELGFEEDPPRNSTLSPLVTAMSYDYYQEDFRTWRNEARPQRDAQGRWLAPVRLRLRFTYGRMTTETTVVLPGPGAALPAF